jgi:hypothetical protein
MRQFWPGNLKPYLELFHIDVGAECVFPVKLRGRLARLRFMADRRSINERVASKDDLPRGVGGLTVRGEKTEFSGFLPHDVASGIAASLASGAFKYVQLDGDVLHRGQALITGMSFSLGYDEAEFSEEGVGLHR